MGGVYVLLYTLPLALRRALRDGFGEEGHELSGGAALVEGEGGKVICSGQDDAGRGRGSVDNGKGVYLHGGGVRGVTLGHGAQGFKLPCCADANAI